MTEMGKSLTYIGTAIVVLAVAFLAKPRIVEYTPNKMIGKPLFEFDILAAKQLKIVKFDEERAKINEFEVAQSTDGLWTIPSKDGYPADAKDQMVDAATLVSGCKVLLVASLDAADHEKLGVVDPTSPNLSLDSKGVGIHMTMQGSKGDVLADLIIGEEVKDAQKQRYVRKAGQDVTYVVEIDPSKLSTRFEDWIEKDLLKLSTWDIQTIELKDYKLEQMLTPNGLAVVVDGKSEMTLSYNNTDSKWIADSIRIFSPDEKKYIETPLAEDEELNSTKLNDLKNSLDDLKIVDIERKPEGLSKDLQASEDFVKSNEAVMSLANRGFLPSRGKDGKIEILSTDGECICTMKNGVEYVIRFGDLRSASSGGTTEKKESEEKTEAPKDSLRRYLFVMARFSENAIEKPKIEDLPPLPNQEAPTETESGKTIGGESTSATPDETDPVNQAEAGAGDNPDSTDTGNTKAAENGSNTAQDPAPATNDAASTSTSGPPQAAEEATDAAKGADDAAKSADDATKGADDAAKSADDAAKSADDAAKGADDAAKSADDAAKSADDAAKSADDAANNAESVDGPAQAKNPDADAADENKDNPSALEKAIEQRKTIEKENQRKLDEYQEKIQEGKDKVKELNDRFGDWYYVIDDEVYKKIHLSREEIIKKKESDKNTEGESTENDPIDAAGFGKPGESIPGLPNLPSTTEDGTSEIPDRKTPKDETSQGEAAEDKAAEGEKAEDATSGDESAESETAKEAKTSPGKSPADEGNTS